MSCLYTSLDTGLAHVVPRVLEQHKNEFFAVVNAKHRLLKLIHEGVIDQDVQRAIEHTNDEDAQEILYHHVVCHDSVEAVIACCKVLIDADGYPNMQALGRKLHEGCAGTSRLVRVTCIIYFKLFISNQYRSCSSVV